MTDDEFTNDRHSRANETRQAGAGQDLQLMSDLDDYQVADDSPDVEGWTVITSDGQRVGKVDDFVVSVSEMRVRYLDIDIGGDRHAMLPVHHAQLDDDNDNVIISSTSVLQDDVHGLRAGSDTGRAGSDDTRRPLDRSAAAPIDADEEIRVPVMREEAVVEKRPVVREEIVIRRRMVTERQTVQADLRRERIDVEGADDSAQRPRSNP